MHFNKIFLSAGLALTIFMHNALLSSSNSNTVHNVDNASESIDILLEQMQQAHTVAIAPIMNMFFKKKPLWTVSKSIYSTSGVVSLPAPYIGLVIGGILGACLG
jgi:hypothetical protein